MKHISNKAAANRIKYKDCDGVKCCSRYKYDKPSDFIKWCKEYGVTKWDTFTDIEFMKGEDENV